MPTDAEMAEGFKKIVKEVAEKSDADVIAFSGDIGLRLDQDLINQVESYRCRPNVFLLLTTNGGSADSAYRIARCLQQGYRDGKVILFVDTYCKSAGTLIALGAHEIIMSDLAELGPLDVQISKSDELAEMTSGLTPVQALSVLRTETFETFENHFLELRFRSGGQITTKTALDIAARMTIGLFEKIYEQLDPMRLGEYQRAMLIAHEYGTRIATNNLKEDSLNRLIASYPSHGFIIDRAEAAELFHRVRPPEAWESELAKFIKSMALETLRKPSSGQVLFLSHDDDSDLDTDNGDDHGAEDGQSGQVPPATGQGSESPPGAGRSEPTGPEGRPSEDKGDGHRADEGKGKGRRKEGSSA